MIFLKKCHELFAKFKNYFVNLDLPTNYIFYETTTNYLRLPLICVDVALRKFRKSESPYGFRHQVAMFR